MASHKSNFCKTNLISVCNANEEKVQKNCIFYDKSSYGDQCMFLHFKQFCDNLEAQENGSNLKKH